MTLKDKYTYLALLALSMFGVGFWMFSVSGGLDNPPEIPKIEFNQSSVSDQFKGSLNLGKGNESKEELFKKIMLIPDTFKQFGSVKCEAKEKIVRNFLPEGQTSYYLSHKTDLSARDFLRRIDPVNFYHVVFHYNAAEKKLASFGTKIGNMPILDSDLDSYIVAAGEPVLVVLLGLQEDEDKASYFDEDEGEFKKLVFVEHCQNSFPQKVPNLYNGWNLVVSDLVKIANDPFSQKISAMNGASAIGNLNLNQLQLFPSDLTGVLTWVLYDTSKKREDFNEDFVRPRVGFNLVSDSEIITSSTKKAIKIAEYELVPSNSPKINAIAFEATNVESGVEFDDLFDEFYLRINNERLDVSDLDDDVLIAYFDDLVSDEVFNDGVMDLSVYAKPKTDNSITNLRLKLSVDLGDRRVASTVLPSFSIEFDSVDVETFFVVKNQREGIDYVSSLDIESEENRGLFKFSVYNSSLNPVDLESIFIPFKKSIGVESMVLSPGENLEFSGLSLDQVSKDFAIDSSGIYIYPNKTLRLKSKEKKIIPFSFAFDKNVSVLLDFDEIVMDSNESEIRIGDRVRKLSYRGVAPLNTIVAEFESSDGSSSILIENPFGDNSSEALDSDSSDASDLERETTDSESSDGTSNVLIENPFEDNSSEDRDSRSSDSNDAVDADSSDSEQTDDPEIVTSDSGGSQIGETNNRMEPPVLRMAPMLNDYNVSVEIEDSVNLFDDEPVKLFTVTGLDDVDFDFDFYAFDSIVEDNLSLHLFDGNEFVEFDTRNIPAGEFSVYVKKSDSADTSYDNLNFGLTLNKSDLGEYTYTFVIRDINVSLNENLLGNFVSKFDDVVVLENTNLINEVELMSLSYVFDDPNDNTTVVPVLIDTNVPDGVKLELRDERGDLIVPCSVDCNYEAFEIEAYLVAVFEPEVFVEKPNVNFNVGFKVGDQYLEEFKYSFLGLSKSNPVVGVEFIDKEIVFSPFESGFVTNAFVGFDLDFSGFRYNQEKYKTASLDFITNVIFSGSNPKPIFVVDDNELSLSEFNKFVREIEDYSQVGVKFLFEKGSVEPESLKFDFVEFLFGESKSIKLTSEKLQVVIDK